MKKAKVCLFAVLIVMTMFAVTACGTNSTTEQSTTSGVNTPTTQSSTTRSGNTNTTTEIEESTTGVIKGMLDDVEEDVSDAGQDIKNGTNNTKESQ